MSQLIIGHVIALLMHPFSARDRVEFSSEVAAVLRHHLRHRSAADRTFWRVLLSERVMALCVHLPWRNFALVISGGSLGGDREEHSPKFAAGDLDLHDRVAAVEALVLALRLERGEALNVDWARFLGPVFAPRTIYGVATTTCHTGMVQSNTRE